MKRKIWLIPIVAVTLAGFFWGIGVEAQRQNVSNPVPAVTTEYLVVAPEEIGVDLNDILQRVDYELTTERLNALAADGWRVKEFGMFNRPAVVLERELVRGEE